MAPDMTLYSRIGVVEGKVDMVLEGIKDLKSNVTLVSESKDADIAKMDKRLSSIEARVYIAFGLFLAGVWFIERLVA